MQEAHDTQRIADQLLKALEAATTIPPVSDTAPGFDSAAAYEVLDHIAASRRRRGWKAVGRKIGFTNRTIWSRYGVDRPMWADMWDRTVIVEDAGRATMSLRQFVQPRIEPEVVFKLKGPVPVTDDPAAVLECVEWMAAGFEIVQCHFPDWRFTSADCTAAFGLHGALVVGKPRIIEHDDRPGVAATLASFVATLSRDGSVMERGAGSNVLDSPALALAHLAGVLAKQPEYRKLAAGEIVTTGTITDAWPISPGETWTSDYGALGLEGLTLSLS